MRTCIFTLLIVVTIGCYNESDCLTGDFSHFIQADNDTLTALGVDWIKDAKACNVGDYIVYSPANGDSDKLWIIGPDHQSIAAIDDDSLTVFTSQRKVLAQFGDRDDIGDYHSLHYEGTNLHDNTKSTIFDFDLDGVSDGKTTYYQESDTFINEHRIAGKWQELVKQNDQYGYIVDGEFYGIEEGKTKLIERSNKSR